MDTRAAWLLAGMLAVALVAAACSSDDPSDDEPAPGPGGTATAVAAGVTILSPENEATVASPVTVEIDVTGTAQAHVHVMIDTGCVGINRAIPSDDQHLHLESGATSIDVDLEPGLRNLCAQLGDATHTAFGTVDFVSITVEGDEPQDATPAPPGGGAVLSPAPGGGVVVSPVPGGAPGPG